MTHTVVTFVATIMKSWTRPFSKTSPNVTEIDWKCGSDQNIFYNQTIRNNSSELKKMILRFALETCRSFQTRNHTFCNVIHNQKKSHQLYIIFDTKKIAPIFFGNHFKKFLNNCKSFKTWVYQKQCLSTFWVLRHNLR